MGGACQHWETRIRRALPNPPPMTKEEAARHLGISTRTFQRWVSRGWISHQSEVTRNGKRIKIFDESDVQRLKDNPPVDTPDDTSADDVDTALVTSKAQSVTSKPSRVATTKPRVTSTDLSGQDILRAIQMPLYQKLLLTVTEAAMVSGLPQTYIRRAIETGELVGKRIGRGMKIRRVDLDAYISKLWQF